MDKKVNFGNSEQQAQAGLNTGELHHFGLITHSSSPANDAVGQLISLSFLLDRRFAPI